MWDWLKERQHIVIEIGCLTVSVVMKTCKSESQGGDTGSTY